MMLILFERAESAHLHRVCEDTKRGVEAGSFSGVGFVFGAISKIVPERQGETLQC